MSRRPAVEVVWPGKYGPDGARVEVPARPLGLAVEQVIGGGEAEPTRAPGLLIGGDNLLAMDALMATHAGAIDLVYIDPPFATGHEFERTTRVGTDAEGPELRSRAYSDRWPGGVAGLLQMLDPRLRRIHRLLAPHGSLYVHVDPIVGHAVKLLLDEIFGPGCFQREIVWRVGWISGFKARANNWIRNHDLIYFYVKDPQRFVFHRQVNPHPAEYRRRKGEADQQGGVPVEDVWNASPAEWRLRGPASLDSIQIKSFSREKTGWATQKNESLLRRIVAASSDEGALVADFFCGAGTTLAAAHALGRRWIGCDSAAAAVELAHARMAERTGSQFVRAGLGPAEREIWLSGQADAWPGPLLRRRKAEVATAPLSGIAGETGVVIGPLAGAVSLAEVAAAVTAAARSGLRRLEVLAWAWDFPAGVELSFGTGIEVVCLQLRRALLDPRGDAGEPPWSERPAVEVAFAVEATATGKRLRARLVTARFSGPTRASAALKATDDPRAAVEGWSLALEAAQPLPASEAGETLTSGAADGVSQRTSSAAPEASSEPSAEQATEASLRVAAQRAVETEPSEARDGSLEGKSSEAPGETSEPNLSVATDASVPMAASEGPQPSVDAKQGAARAGSSLSAAPDRRRMASESSVAAGASVHAASDEVSQLSELGEARDGALPGESQGAASRAAADGAGHAVGETVEGSASASAAGSALRVVVVNGDGFAGVHRPVFAAARTRNRRELDGETGWIELTGAGPWTARVRVVDVLGGETWHAWHIERIN